MLLVRRKEKNEDVTSGAKVVEFSLLVQAWFIHVLYFTFKKKMNAFLLPWMDARSNLNLHHYFILDQWNHAKDL